MLFVNSIYIYIYIHKCYITTISTISNTIYRNEYVHLDIKPGNILLKNGHYKLSDFGLAIRVDDNGWSKNASLVEEGDTKYMARELLDWGSKDLRKCDVFSLGASIYELSNGYPMPSEGLEWQALRNGTYKPPTYPMIMNNKTNSIEMKNEISLIISDLLHADPLNRLSPSEYIQRYRGLQSKMERKLLDSENTISLLTNQLNGVPTTTTDQITISSSITTGSGIVNDMDVTSAAEDIISDINVIPKNTSTSRYRLKRSHTVQ